MDADLLLQTLTFIAPLSAGLQQAFAGYITEDYYTKEGKECTSWFMGQGDIMISIYSFLTQQPAAESIEILEHSVIQSMSWTDLQAIYADFKEFNYIGRIVTEKYYIQSEERSILLRTLSARERYELLLKSHPGILKKASMGQVASYLGISPETLSRVRGKKGILT